jgi:hypothetical protein
VNFADWLSMGLKHGWLTEPWCMLHGEPELSEDDLERVGDGECLFAAQIRAAG